MGDLRENDDDTHIEMPMDIPSQYQAIVTDMVGSIGADAASLLPIIQELGCDYFEIDIDGAVVVIKLDKPEIRLMGKK